MPSSFSLYISTTVTLVALLLSSPDARAELSVSDYQRKKKDPAVQAFLAGFGSGVEWYGAALKANNQVTVYCPPMTLALNVDNYVQVLDNYLARTEGAVLLEKNAPLGGALMMALQHAFPCRPQK